MRVKRQPSDLDTGVLLSGMSARPHLQWTSHPPDRVALRYQSASSARVFGHDVAPDGALLPIPDPPVAVEAPAGPADGCNIKGNVSYETGERIYHVAGQAYYQDTMVNEEYGERWFCTEEEAVAAGWRKSHM